MDLYRAALRLIPATAVRTYSNSNEEICIKIREDEGYRPKKEIYLRIGGVYNLFCAPEDTCWCSKTRGVTYISGMTSLNIDSSFRFKGSFKHNESFRTRSWRDPPREVSWILSDRLSAPCRKFLQKRTAQIKNGSNDSWQSKGKQTGIYRCISIYLHIKETSHILLKLSGFCETKWKIQ